MNGNNQENIVSWNLSGTNSNYPNIQCNLHIYSAKADIIDILNRTNNELRKYGKKIKVQVNIQLENLGEGA